MGTWLRVETEHEAVAALGKEAQVRMHASTGADPGGGDKLERFETARVLALKGFETGVQQRKVFLSVDEFGNAATTGISDGGYEGGR